jgi:hypothetical protein
MKRCGQMEMGPQLLDINTPANAPIVMRDGFC